MCMDELGDVQEGRVDAWANRAETSHPAKRSETGYSQSGQRPSRKRGRTNGVTAVHASEQREGCAN